MNRQSFLKSIPFFGFLAHSFSAKSDTQKEAKSGWNHLMFGKALETADLDCNLSDADREKICEVVNLILEHVERNRQSIDNKVIAPVSISHTYADPKRFRMVHMYFERRSEV